MNEVGEMTELKIEFLILKALSGTLVELDTSFYSDLCFD